MSPPCFYAVHKEILVGEWVLGRGCGICESMHLQREREILCRRARSKKRAFVSNRQ